MKKRATTGFIKTMISGILLLIIISCGGRPKDVLSEDKMVSLLVDMELTEAYVNTQMSANNSVRIEMGRKVLEAHGVTEAQLDTTLAWYGRNMDEYAELFEKVDKEIIKRQKKFTDVPGAHPKEADNMWPYPTHLILSPMSGYESFTFSLPESNLEKGGILNMSFYLPNSAAFKGMLGVEYSDGYGEASVSNFTSKHKIEMTLQTDTAKEVTKIYGSLLLKDTKALPLYIDSIALKLEPIDSMAYKSKKRSQKQYGIMRPQKEPEKVVVKDTLQNIEVETTTDNPAPAKIEEEMIKTENKPEQNLTPNSRTVPARKFPADNSGRDRGTKQPVKQPKKK